MRKFSKILTVLLTVCLLCGVIMSVVASAEETKNQLNITEATYNRNVDFEDGSVGSWNNYRGEYAKLEVVEAANGNKYYSFTSNTSVTADAANNIQLGWKACNSYSAASGDNGETVGDAYVVIDFDIGTDRYVYTDADGIKHTVDPEGKPITSVDQIPEGCEYAPAYSTSGSYFTLRVKASESAGFSEQYQALGYKIAQDANGWYMYNHNYSSNSKKIYLSGQVGVFDHVTFVLRNVYNEDGTLKTLYAYQFVNGEFMNAVNYGYYDVHMEKLTISEEKYLVGKSDKFAMAYDNLAINHYPIGDKHCAGLDAFFATESYRDVNFTNCTDVVYTADYKTPNPEIYATVNGTKYNVIPAAFDVIRKNGGTITINSSLLNYNVSGVKSFTVIAENGAKFSLNSSCAASYDVTETVDGNTTTYVFVAKGTFSDRNVLNITGDYHNHFNAYTDGTQSNNGNSGSVWNGVTNGYAQINDGDFFKGVGYGVNSTYGIYELYKHPTQAATYPNNPATQFWYMSPYRPSASGWNAADITDYDYVIADFDFGTNRYTYVDAEGVHHTAFTLPEGVTEAKPAYMNGMSVGVSYNGYSTTTDPGKYTEGRYSTKFEVQIVYNENDGLYYASADTSYSSNDIVLSNKVGEFDHVSFVFDVANKKIVAFVNGQYVNETPYNASWQVVNFAATCATVPAAIKANDVGSLAVDNNAINWYKDAADTDTGINAFMKGDYKNGKLYNCDDVLYNASYVPHCSYASFSDGSREFLPGIINDKISALGNDGKVTSPVDLLGVNPTADVIYVQLTGDAKTVALSPEADMYIIEDQGNGLYKVRKLAEEDLVNVSVVDREDKVIDTFYLAPNKELIIPPAIDLDEFDVATRKVYTLNGWYITVDGVESAAAGYKYSDITAVSKELKVYPKFDEAQVAETFAIYTVEADGTKKLVGTPADYASMANFQSKVQAATSGMTVVLLYDINTPYDVNIATKSQITIEIKAYQNVSLDLNGRTLVHSYGGTSAYGGVMFKVHDGATFNLYSSVPGGAIYQARPHTDRGNSSYGQVCAPGIIGVYSIAAATINIDGAVDQTYKDNLSVYGGTLFYSSGCERTAEVVVNVEGGYYYAPTRSASSIFTTQNSGGAYYNLKDATFYVAHPSAYGIFHDYSGASYPKAGSHVVADGCIFVAYNTNSKAPGALFYGSDATSTAKFTDCIIIGKIGGSIQIEIGEGCIVAGSTTGSRAKLADGVSKTASDLNYSITMFDHPDLPFYDVTELNKDGTENTNYSAENDPIIKDAETGKYYLNPKIYDKNNWVDGETLYFSSAYMTYGSDESAPEYDVVKGLDKDGNTLISAKWIKSSVAVKAPSSSFNMDMYKVSGATWNATEDKFTFVLADYSVVGNFQGMLTNATLSTGMTYNIYIPADAGVTVTGVGDNATLLSDLFVYADKSYYHVAVDLAAAEFATTVTVSFSVPSIAGEGNKAGSQVLSADIVAYANKVVSSDFYAHESDEANLVYTMVAYKNEVAKYLGGESYVQPESVTKFFTEAHKDCACGSVEIYYPADYGFDEYDTAADLEEVGITGATFSIEGTNFLSFILEGDAGLEVNVSYDTPVGTVNLTAEYNEEMGCYVVPGVTAAHIDEVFTITVDGVSAVYSLASYIENAEENVIPLVEALARYAAAAEDYKYVTVDEVE